MKIGDVAKACDLSTKTLRYYEEISLITAERTGNGYRLYSAKQVEQLRFISRARALGFGLESCRGLLQLQEDGTRASSDVKQLAIEHLKQIKEKINELEVMHTRLSQLVDACQGDNDPDCPILDDLAEA